MSDTSRYLAHVPKTVPPGRIVIHNRVQCTPGQVPGVRGFRAWTDVPDGNPFYVLCECRWAPHLGDHYRVDISAARSPDQ